MLSQELFSGVCGDYCHCWDSEVCVCTKLSSGIMCCIETRIRAWHVWVECFHMCTIIHHKYAPKRVPRALVKGVLT